MGNERRLITITDRLYAALLWWVLADQCAIQCCVGLPCGDEGQRRTRQRDDRAAIHTRRFHGVGGHPDQHLTDVYRNSSGQQPLLGHFLLARVVAPSARPARRGDVVGLAPCPRQPQPSTGLDNNERPRRPPALRLGIAHASDHRAYRPASAILATRCYGSEALHPGARPFLSQSTRGQRRSLGHPRRSGTDRDTRKHRASAATERVVRRAPGFTHIRQARFLEHPTTYFGRHIRERRIETRPRQ